MKDTSDSSRSKSIREIDLLPLHIEDGVVFWEVYMKADPQLLLSGEPLRDVLSRFRLKPVAIDVRSPPLKSGLLDALLIVDSSEVESSPSEVEARLKDMKGVSEVAVSVCPIQGLGFPVSTYLHRIAGCRAIVLRDRFFSVMVNGIKESWGPAGAITLYYIGKEVGEDSFEAWSGLLRVKGRMLAEAMLYIGRLTGFWEDFEILEYNEAFKYVLLRLYGSVECKGVKADKPNSYFIRGLLEEVASRILGVEMKSKEVKCIAVGDPYCEFRFTQKRNGKHL